MRRERGSAALLLPACVLLVVVLGGITVDHAHAFLAQRELANAVSAAANDAATAIDAGAYYASGQVILDPAAAERRAAAALTGRRGTVAELTSWRVHVLDRGRVEVEATGVVHRIIGGGLPGGASAIRVHARATAEGVHA